MSIAAALDALRATYQQLQDEMARIEQAVALLEAVPPPVPRPAPPARECVTGGKACTLCPRVLETAGARQVHENRDHTSGRRATCPSCQAVYGTDRGMKRHHAACTGGLAFNPPPEPDLELPRADPELLDDVPVTRRDLAGPGPLWAPGEPMLACGTCKWYHVDGEALDLHTKANHGRRATRTERTPLTDTERQARLVAVGSIHA